MALTPHLTTISGSTPSGYLVKAIEVTPAGGCLEIRIYSGTDNTGTEIYRIRAMEKSEFRYFPEGVQLGGPTYLEFYEGEGGVTAFL